MLSFRALAAGRFAAWWRQVCELCSRAFCEKTALFEPWQLDDARRFEAWRRASFRALLAARLRLVRSESNVGQYRPSPGAHSVPHCHVTVAKASRFEFHLWGRDLILYQSLKNQPPEDTDNDNMILLQNEDWFLT